MQVLVTGAAGFVGRHLLTALLKAGHQVTAVVRRMGVVDQHPSIREIVMGDLGPDSDWREALQGVDVIMHTAARTHTIREKHVDPESAYRRINVEATTALAEQAVANGISRFILLSSVKAGGEESVDRVPLKIGMLPQPEDAYGRTKLAAEQILFKLCEETEMEVIILRPPLIYGPGIKGNLLSLFRAVDKGLPLPLRGIDNRRDLLYVGNLVAAMIHAMSMPSHLCGTYYVSDGQAVSVPELVRQIANALDRPSRLLPVPLFFLRGLGAASGKSELIKRLMGSLEIDSNTFCQVTNWNPPFAMKEGLAQTAAWYLSHKSNN